MSKTYRPHDPEQQLLMPAALQVWLPPEHMAYLISDAVEELDLSVIMARYKGEGRAVLPTIPGCWSRCCLRLLHRGGLLDVSKVQGSLLALLPPEAGRLSHGG